MDAVINHTGPATPQDPAWPGDWVRTAPNCSYKSYVTTVDCTLVATLPDIRTDRDAPVALPPALLEKWQQEGRREREVAELDAFFERTGYPRAPRYYVIKWLTDWVRELGFDGYRLDTAKHFEPAVSAELRREAEEALSGLEADAFGSGSGQPACSTWWARSTVGSRARAREYSFGDRTVDFFSHGYDALINFGFKSDTASLDGLFSRYSAMLDGGITPRGQHAQLHQLSRRRIAVRSRPEGSHRRRDATAARTRGRSDLLRRRAGAAAEGLRGRGRCEPAVVHELGRSGAPGRGSTALAQAGAIPSGPSCRGGRRTSHASGEAVHLQPHARVGGQGPIACWWRWIRERGPRRSRCLACSPMAPNWWTHTRACSHCVRDGKVSLTTGSGLVLLAEPR